MEVLCSHTSMSHAPFGAANSTSHTTHYTVLVGAYGAEQHRFGQQRGIGRERCEEATPHATAPAKNKVFEVELTTGFGLQSIPTIVKAKRVVSEHFTQRTNPH
ncbi:hypothetical protein CEXT_369761 [Caerostris extrusa]|uniref:Uncharacterized protein n=1 Tax=Caerostris extrusa TaxID=172846 RepID=A0AAV4UPB0_CAEEX|nr:hypothetical protein CEXT_369761 [Caerostris extrusa]